MRILRKICLCAVVAILSTPALAAWTSVGTGIDYQEFTVSGPNNVFVTRMDRANTACAIESTIAQGQLASGKETVRNQASRYDGAINYVDQIWGQRNDVVVAVNGDFYNLTTGVPTGGQIQSGWYCKEFPNFGGWSGMGWKLNRDVFMGGCVYNRPNRRLVTYLPSGSTQEFKGINRSPADGELTIFTPHYDRQTPTDSTVTEVVVELTTPMVIKPTPSMVTGYVREIRLNQGSTPIPFDSIVLSAKGSAATTLLSRVSVGLEIGVSQELPDYNLDCNTSSGNDWTKTYACAGGNFIYLRNNVIQSTDNVGLTSRQPRTAVAYNDTYIFFIVVDGRSGVSVGMSMNELGSFCQSYLGATWGYNQDGGGSSTMVVNGVVKNVPSDGSERQVANGLMMINVLPKVQSSSFGLGSTVKTTTSTNVRLGPGTNYETLTSVAANTEGEILDHPLRGLSAKGYSWWKVDFGGTVGWAAESLLTLVTSGDAPTITQHPVDQTVSYGGSASFTVQATGLAPLSYQWQQDEVDLVAGEHYSGVQSTTLLVTDATASQQGPYRCVVTNDSGSATSNEATLTVVSGAADFDIDGDVDLDDFGFLQNCLGLTNVAQTPACVPADLNGDTNVDANDLDTFIGAMTGAYIPIPGQ